MVRAQDLRSVASPVRFPAVALSGAALDKLFTHVCLRHEAVVMLCRHKLWKETVGLESHWPCVTDITTYGLTAHGL